MVNDNLRFDIGNKIKIAGAAFSVDGYIVFEDNYGASWIEYKLKSKNTFQVKWLSIDRINNEYAVYIQQSYSSDFIEENISAKGYKTVEDSSAKVVDYSGNVDVDLGEVVFYKEYEDNTEELLLSVEQWNGELEYSKGYYIDKEDIENLSFHFDDNLNISQSNNREGSYASNINKKKIGIVIGIILFIIATALIIKSCSSNNTLSKFIKSNSNFQYVTSVTSDLDTSKKADVYSTNKTVEEATKLIISGVKGKIGDVQENKDDSTVVVTLSDELALIYVSENKQTLVQVSTRKYVYSSRTTPYRGTSITNMFFRNYYYRSFYNTDRNRYGNAPNGYSDYTNGTFTPNNNNKYRNYSDSIRQESAKSRSSSGGGISSGK